MGVEGDDDLGQCQPLFKLLQVRYFISSNSNLSQRVQYRDMKLEHVNKQIAAHWHACSGTL
jgi:hypothetical protein